MQGSLCNSSPLPVGLLAGKDWPWGRAWACRVSETRTHKGKQEVGRREVRVWALASNPALIFTRHMIPGRIIGDSRG